MKKIYIIVLLSIVFILTGCSNGYYCDDGDQLVGDQCLKKFTYTAKASCRAGYVYTSTIPGLCCWQNRMGNCYTPEYKCREGDIQSGNTCYAERYYDAYKK